jgi:hypothetical protein
MAVRDGTKTITAREGTKNRSSTLEAVETMPEPRTQRRKPDERFRLQVDRQTKQSYATSDEAEQAGRIIKKAYPIVQVAVYDAQEGVNTIIELVGANVAEKATAAAKAAEKAQPAD